MTTLLSAIKNELNVGYTENGAQVYNSTGSALLNFFTLGGALRNTPEEEITSLFKEALYDDPQAAVRMMFYFRDVRGGQGQREAFRTQIRWLANQYTSFAEKVMKHVPEYGRWDDMYAFMDTPLESQALKMMFDQFRIDMINLESYRPISLLGKWLKSENASSKKTKALAKKTRKAFGMDSKSYRQALSMLRKGLDVVERKASKNQWEQIQYPKVPSQAMMKYRTAFFKNDTARFSQYVSDVQQGKTKVNAGTLYPYQIVEKVFKSCHSSYIYDDVTIPPVDNQERIHLNNLWNALPDYVKGSNENSLVVVDTSGSMYGIPLNVAVSLGIYMSERNTGPFKDHFITFSADPELQKVRGQDIMEKVNNLSRAKWDMNTNMESVFDLILKAALKENMTQEELPSRLYIISDMQFDQCTTDKNQFYMDAMREKFAEHGYNCPELVFWNVDVRSNIQVPMTMDHRGFLNVSGFSPSILESLLSNQYKSARDFMYEVINAERYQTIEIY